MDSLEIILLNRPHSFDYALILLIITFVAMVYVFSMRVTIVGNIKLLIMIEIIKVILFLTLYFITLRFRTAFMLATSLYQISNVLEVIQGGLVDES